MTTDTPRTDAEEIVRRLLERNPQLKVSDERGEITMVDLVEIGIVQYLAFNRISVKRTRELERELAQAVRERDEALKESDRQTEIADAMTNYVPDAKREADVVAERDQLLKVCDEFGDSCMDGYSLNGFRAAFTSYNSLPHVKERNKC